MNLCVFQGTFNPIHNAHLRVAKYVMDKYKFDKLIFIPAFNPPHKNCDKAMAQHRFNMVKTALNQYKNIEVYIFSNDDEARIIMDSTNKY